MDKLNQSDHEASVAPHEDTRPVDDDSDSIQSILHQLLEQTMVMESRLDELLASTEKVRHDLEEADEDESFD